MRRRVLIAVALALVAVSCADPGPVATINGIEIDGARLESLRPEGAQPVAEQVAGDLLLLLLHDGFADAALDEFGVAVTTEQAEAAFEARTRSAAALGPLDDVLANRGVTRERVRLEAGLDALRELVAAELIRAEAAGFDVDAAYREYVIRAGEVCVQAIALAAAANYEAAESRLLAGEPFAAVAEELSLDPLVGPGEARAGGDLGCSVPFALPVELHSVSLDAPIGEPIGPVAIAGGPHLVLVYRRDIPELESVRGEVREAAVAEQGEAVFRAWAFDVLVRADVTIDPDYGSWGPRPGTGDVPTVIPAG